MGVVHGFVGLTIITGYLWLAEYLQERYVFSKPEYQDLLRKVDQTSKQIAKIEAAPGNGDSKSSEKQQRRLKVMKDELALHGRNLRAFQARGQLWGYGGTVLLYLCISSYFAGVVVAKLPFAPFRVVTNVTHRGLPGDDFTDAALSCILCLSMMGIRPTMQKFYKHELPKALEEPWPPTA